MQKERYGAVLTCKKALIPFYEKNGVLSEGISASVHGNATWYQMRSVFIPERVETEHLVLRKAEKKDADALYEHILRFEESRKWLEEFQKESEKDNRMQYVVDEKNGDTCIGFAGIGYEGMRTFEEHGISLGPEWCSRHYGGEILDAFLEYSLGKCKGEKFVYGCLKKIHHQLILQNPVALCLREKIICILKKITVITRIMYLNEMERIIVHPEIVIN